MAHTTPPGDRADSIPDPTHRTKPVPKPTPSRLSLDQKGALYEQTIAAEYLSWVESWIRRHPGDGFVATHISGDPGAPAICVAGPPGAIVNETIGLGLDGPVTPGELDAMEETFARAGSSMGLVEISPSADQDLPRLVAERGYRLRNVLHVFFADLTALPTPPTPPTPTTPATPGPEGPGVGCEVVDKADPQAVEEAVRTVALAMQSRDAGEEPDPHQALIARQVITCERATTVLARVDGRPAGAASMGLWRDHPLSEGHLNLYQGATMPWARGRGVQMALIRARLVLGRAAGATSASLDCLPRAGTVRNAPRAGFELIYSKPVLVKWL